ncbi:MAG TPA: helix-turn-helix domain-containing protein [Candidatus Saccharimonadales bacterium]|nr:helix-turn-helix domain-containing protein [Candidatus Saccharimonadales bacterium]
MAMQAQSITLDSPHIKNVTLTRFDQAGHISLAPDGSWDIVFIRHEDHFFAVRTGLTTKPVVVEHSPGDEILAFSFNASSFMPAFSAPALRNEGVDLTKIGGGRFWLGSELYQIPTLETAQNFAEALVQKGAVKSNDLVASVLSGTPQAMSERTLQRHFLKTTGLTYKAFEQIMRAQKAVQMLQTGQPALQVAFALGYSDQSHLINSLKLITGQTPKQISKARAG